MPTSLKAARFPVYKDLSGFDFASSETNEALVRQLYRCEFIENADNVVLVGGPGTGKTTSPRRLACRRLNTIAKRFGSSGPSTWSMRWSRRELRADRVRSRIG